MSKLDRISQFIYFILLLATMFVYSSIASIENKRIIDEIRKHDNHVDGFWKGGTLYLSHEDYVRFENLRQTGSYPVKEFER